MNPAFDTLTEAALRLNPFAVVTRYDDAFWPEIEEAQDALEAARCIRRFVQERFPEEDNDGEKRG
jgi:hypothetical protein